MARRAVSLECTEGSVNGARRRCLLVDSDYIEPLSLGNSAQRLCSWLAVTVSLIHASRIDRHGQA